MFRKLELNRETLKQLHLKSLNEAQQAHVVGGTDYMTGPSKSAKAHVCGDKN